MLVCPHCRSENAEEATACQVCRRALEPTESHLRRTEGTERLEDEFDLRPSRRPRAWPGILALVVLAAGLGGVWLWFSNRPSPCEGKFVSPLFGYCITIPAGWTGGSIRTPVGAIDRYEPEEPGAEVVVLAGEAVPGTTSEQYAQGIRSTQETLGVTVGPIQSVEVGEGTPAVAWQATVRADDGTILQQRTVALIRNGLGYRILLGGDGSIFDEARFAFEQILSSWGWNDP